MKKVTTKIDIPNNTFTIALDEITRLMPDGWEDFSTFEFEGTFLSRILPKSLEEFPDEPKAHEIKTETKIDIPNNTFTIALNKIAMFMPDGWEDYSVEDFELVLRSLRLPKTLDFDDDIDLGE